MVAVALGRLFCRTLRCIRKRATAAVRRQQKKLVEKLRARNLPPEYERSFLQRLCASDENLHMTRFRFSAQRTATRLAEAPKAKPLERRRNVSADATRRKSKSRFRVSRHVRKTVVAAVGQAKCFDAR